MSKCKISRNLELAKKDLLRVVMFAFTPLPEKLIKMDGIKFAIPFSSGRRIIMSFDKDEGDFKVSAEFETGSNNISCLYDKVIGRYDVDDNPEKPIEDCLRIIIDKIYSL